MKEKLLAFLKALEAAVPVSGGRHHSITFNQFGSDSVGWEDKLGLHVWIPNGHAGAPVQTFFLEDGDLEKPVDILVAEIKAAFQ